MRVLAGISATWRVTSHLQLLATELDICSCSQPSLARLSRPPAQAPGRPRYDRTYRDGLARGPALLVSPGRVFLLRSQSIGIRLARQNTLGQLGSGVLVRQQAWALSV
jgi:hypothetical protein